jgi:putative phosphonate catabolism associated alcohol dehydrogenase
MFDEPGRPFRLITAAVPEPRGREVLVRVACCTLCGSDLHTHAGRRREATPTVLGHEIVGRIVAFGPDAPQVDLGGTKLAIGDRVTWSIVVSCHQCCFCTGGLPQKCEHLIKYGHRLVTPDRPFTGGLADYVLLEAGTAVLRLPDRLPDPLAAVASCAGATAAAVVWIGGVAPASSVVVFGAGPLGLTACAMARAAGATAVIACDTNMERRARAAECSATAAASPAAGEIDKIVATETAGRGADVVFELAGAVEAIGMAFSLVRTGGTIMLAGTVFPTPAVPFDPQAIVRRMLTIPGCHNYAPMDLATAVDFFARPEMLKSFSALIGPTFRLDETEAAFGHAHVYQGPRVVVVP